MYININKKKGMKKQNRNEDNQDASKDHTSNDKE